MGGGAIVSQILWQSSSWKEHEFIMPFTFQPQVIDPLLKDCIGEFLQTLQDPDLNVRRVALVTFNSAAHNKPPLIRDLLESMLPHLYNETKVRVCSIGACRIYSEIITMIIATPLQWNKSQGR